MTGLGQETAQVDITVALAGVLGAGGLGREQKENGEEAGWGVGAGAGPPLWRPEQLRFYFLTS